MRPPGSPPMPPAKKMQIEASRPKFAERVRQDYGIEMHPGPFEVNSIQPHILSKYAEAQGLGKEYQEAAMQAYWEKGQAIDDTAVLKDIARQIGLEITDLDQILENPEYVKAFQSDLDEAYDNQFNGVPALVFGEKYLVSGAQPYETLVQVTERVKSEGL